MENRIGYFHIVDEKFEKEISNVTTSHGTAIGYTTITGGKHTNFIGNENQISGGYGRVAFPTPPAKPDFMKVKDWLQYKRLQLEMDNYVRASYAQANVARGVADYIIPVRPISGPYDTTRYEKTGE